MLPPVSHTSVQHPLLGGQSSHLPLHRRSPEEIADLLTRLQHGLAGALESKNAAAAAASHGTRAAPWALLAALALGKGRALRFLRLVFRSLALLSKVAASVGAAAAAAAYLYNKSRKRTQRRPCKRVAVVGGGIAGTGAAWTLDKAGIDVVLYEKKPTLGGNAKTFGWDVEGTKVTTGLAVLAWPDALFHSYNALIEELGVETDLHELKYFIAERNNRSDGPNKGGVDCVFAHGREGWTPEPWLQADLLRWGRVAAFVKGVNRVMQPAEAPSMYRVNTLNPLNLIPLKTLCRLFGLSNRFWECVFVPVHTSTFLEVEMGDVPAVMAELLDEIVPFNTTPQMRTWKEHPGVVFDRIRERMRPTSTVKTRCEAERVEFDKVSLGEGGGYRAVVLDEDGHSETFDAVIFACSAPATNRLLHGAGAPAPGAPAPKSNNRNGLDQPGASLSRRALGWIEQYVLGNTMYTVDRDKAFVRGVVHSDAAAVFPAKFKDELLEHHCNYVEVDGADPKTLENTFILSSWAPAMQELGMKGKKAMLVTYAEPEKTDKVDSEWTVTSREAHPCLTTWQMFSATQLWPIFQGSRDGTAYFCGSAVTPGNGHDLSFLSGIVAAGELGAPFPFPSKPSAVADYGRLRGMMLSWWA